ncbi:hypothetical protein B296_00026885 [Ensete ventricosum]|uniref:Uncharacterized protein n=1 Tax=Ensete ventricosum TaxID=4639 RepID=A0A426X669_ENSVE|nr:hypothetical protein B296_00026885 [Ensete ventricosum]
MLAIPYVLANGKSYEHRFMKKCNDHKHCISRMQSQVLNGLSCTISKIQNTSHSQCIRPWNSYKHGFTKNVTVINFTQSDA